MPQAKALVNPLMLRWAREAAGYSLSEAATRVKRPVSEVAAWETEKGEKPSLAQARKLAGVYKRTLSVFYLAEPPEEPALPPDYRRSKNGASSSDLSPGIRYRVRQLHALREAVLDLADADGDSETEAFPPFPVKATLDEPPAAVAKRLRDALGVDVDAQRRWTTPEKAWSHWREAIERLSCLVFVVDRVAAGEFDGFSLAFDRAPVIAINGNSQLSFGRRVFTLLHELAHIALRSEGVCNLVDRAARAESFCNRTAAAILLPAGPFREAAGAISQSRPGTAWSDGALQQLATTFGASLQAVYVRLVALNLAEQPQYEAWVRARERDRSAPSTRPETTSETGPRFYTLYMYRMSTAYLRHVFASYHDDRLSLSELSDYLGVRPNTAVALDERFLKRLRGRAS